MLAFAVLNGTEENPYADMQTALDAAYDGDTISLSGDMTITEALSVTKSITINGTTR